MAQSPFREMNSGNEALTQLRPLWDKVLVLTMRKAGLKELTIDMPDVAPLLASPPIVVVLGRKHLGPDHGFTIILADSQAEMMELLAKHQGKG